MFFLWMLVGFLGACEVNGSPVPVYVVGERNSGTKIAASMIIDSCPLPEDMNSWSDLSNTPLGWKHLFQEFSDEQAEEVFQYIPSFWIILVRDPCEWMYGMYRNQWHRCKTGNCHRHLPSLQTREIPWPGETFGRFLQSPWIDVVGEPTPVEYKNVYEIRRRFFKYAAIIRENPHSVVIPTEDTRDPPVFFTKIQHYGGPNCNKTTSLEITPRVRVKCTREEYEMMKSLIDWDLEAQWGITKEHACTFINPQ